MFYKIVLTLTYGTYDKARHFLKNRLRLCDRGLNLDRLLHGITLSRFECIFITLFTVLVCFALYFAEYWALKLDTILRHTRPSK